MRLFNLLIILLFSIVSAIYYKVDSETCSQLSSADELFDNLIIPCASFK